MGKKNKKNFNVRNSPDEKENSLNEIPEALEDAEEKEVSNESSSEKESRDKDVEVSKGLEHSEEKSEEDIQEEVPEQEAPEQEEVNTTESSEQDSIQEEKESSEELDETPDETMTDESVKEDDVSEEQTQVEAFAEEAPKSNSSKKKMAAIGIAGAVLLIAALAIAPQFGKGKIKLKEDVFKNELGTEVSSDPRSYLNGDEDEVSKAKVNVSKVDTKKVGEYEAEAYVGNKTLRFRVKVADTTAPVIEVKEDFSAYAGEEFTSDSFITSVKDASGLKSFKIEDGVIGQKSDLTDTSIPLYTLMFKSEGQYTIAIQAEDKHGNKVEKNLKVKIKEFETKGLPEIIEVEQGKAYDWLKDVESKEGITQAVEVDTTEIDLNNAGEYKAAYKFILKNGNPVNVSVPVKVTAVTKATSDTKEEKTETKTPVTTNTQQPTQQTQTTDDKELNNIPDVEIEEEYTYIGNSGKAFSTYDKAIAYGDSQVKTGVKSYDVTATGDGRYTVDLYYK
ncbi:hypothetical protein M2146_001038 [Lachnospiraceae bacterium PF1-22]